MSGAGARKYITAKPNGFVNARTGRAWATPLKDGDLERILERLDRIVREVGPIVESIEQRLGVDLDQEGTDRLLAGCGLIFLGCNDILNAIS